MHYTTLDYCYTDISRAYHELDAVLQNALVSVAYMQCTFYFHQHL